MNTNGREENVVAGPAELADAATAVPDFLKRDCKRLWLYPGYRSRGLVWFRSDGGD
jgi:hypothetical protein